MERCNWFQRNSLFKRNKVRLAVFVFPKRLKFRSALYDCHSFWLDNCKNLLHCPSVHTLGISSQASTRPRFFSSHSTLVIVFHATLEGHLMLSDQFQGLEGCHRRKKAPKSSPPPPLYPLGEQKHIHLCQENLQCHTLTMAKCDRKNGRSENVEGGEGILHMKLSDSEWLAQTCGLSCPVFFTQTETLESCCQSPSAAPATGKSLAADARDFLHAKHTLQYWIMTLIECASVSCKQVCLLRLWGSCRETIKTYQQKWC